MRATFAGVTATDLYVTVHAEVRDQGWCKYVAIKVPLVSLLHPEITDAMDRAVRRQLAIAWDAGSTEPLF